MTETAAATTEPDVLRLLDEPEAPGAYGDLEPSSPPLIDDEGRVRLSFSRVDTYRNCPTKFRYSYIDRLPGQPGPHLSFGTSIHAALEAFYDRKLPDCPSEEELLGYLYDAWDSSGFAGTSREEQLAFYRHAQDALRRFHRRVAPTYRLPVDTEAWFELPVGDLAIVVGSIDRVDVDEDGELHVIDYKTNRKAKQRRYVAGSLQLAIYALACEHLYGRLPASVSLDFVVAGVEVRVGLDELDLDATRAAVTETAQGVLDARYEPTPNRLCDWCDYRALCPAWEGGAEGEDLLGPAVTELARLRRQVERDVRALRELEAGVEAAGAALRSRGLDPVAPDAARPVADGQAVEPDAAGR
ncbi:MAG: PD-(D/E)XK nuclease family protein [Actinobacteria bacterium]|nr:PD-(D/E)XK nuclease family protein [Actinomycetota bacterium]